LRFFLAVLPVRLLPFGIASVNLDLGYGDDSAEKVVRLFKRRSSRNRGFVKAVIAREVSNMKMGPAFEQTVEPGSTSGIALKLRRDSL